jgi:hypothetical protein
MAGRIWIRACGAVIATAVGMLAGAGSASAEPCTTALTDASGNSWSQGSGAVGSLPVFAGAITGFVGPPVATPLVTTPATCVLQQGDRELSGPAQVVAPGLTVARRMYVPAGSPAFVRVLDQWTNVSGAPITVEPLIANSNLANRWRQTSSGDAVVSTADDWVVLTDTDAPADPAFPVVGEIWSGPGGTRPTALSQATPGLPPWTSGILTHMARWADVTIGPGDSRFFMYAWLIRPAGAPGLASAIADTAAVASDARLYDGISQDDQLRLVNFPPLDADLDGLRDTLDNCPKAVNPDQLDTDGDGQGNACDADDDGDGLPDAIELALGGNPLIADTDGDGRPDGVDSCLTLAAATADGCPAAQSATPQAPAGEKPADTTAPILAIDGVAKTMKKKAFLKGVTATIACDEPCTIDGDLLGTARSVRLAAAFNLTLGTQSLALGGGPRKLTVKPSKRLVGKAKKLTVQLRVTATDASGNRAKKTQTIKVK